jgi:predicted PurR-regulated permease PerM
MSLPSSRNLQIAEGGTMTTLVQLAPKLGYMNRSREVFIRMSLLALMAVTCLLILKPFLLLILWSMILAIATYPGYRWLGRVLHGRERWAAAICIVLLLAIVIIPALLLAGTLTGAAHSLAISLENGSLRVPPPPEKVASWPVIGASLMALWAEASNNLSAVLAKLSPYLRAYAPQLLSASASIAGTMLQFIIAIVIAGFLLTNSKANAEFSGLLFHRIFGEKGHEFEELTESTVRSVTNGILGVAVIQSVFAGIGFMAVGLPGAGMWAAIFLVASVLQVGPLVMIPAVIYAFAITSTGHAVLFLVWCAIVGLMDNVLKPLMLGRGSKVPTAVIFIGVIGGFVAMGIVGLFVGAIILSVGYKLFLSWLREDETLALSVPEA